ncbi:nitroreductase family deazaflavin-dependent oxidoreductase [Actinophytocola gossypii]|uniref:Nitroreductase family deazaflavin-dependent oxidoreductase n=1 Tax=Actinophytocola gossypii TaxID=2812003 RepID=A0ABT2JA72_9PSEU|nr:nitroreductase family deazaflavin-dependent oxidoreductase [Actinophytocola gossypii]MCT2584479.1 nitroreductase family deazaflavin-dependent oxidoreductase [Actinophytocola gossypii]
MEIVKQVGLPKGLSRLLFRLPIAFYRRGLGWMFGGRLMLVHHVGRVTGKRRQVVLEVIAHDAGDGYVVASGWGPGAAWYRNVLHTPDVTIQVGRRTIPVTGVPLPVEEGAEIMAKYASRHRMAAKFLLPRLMGFSVDGSADDFRAVGRHMPFIRFVPRTNSGVRVGRDLPAAVHPVGESDRDQRGGQEEQEDRAPQHRHRGDGDALS